MNERLINIFTWRANALKYIKKCVDERLELWISRNDIASELWITVWQVSKIKSSKDTWLWEKKIQSILDILYNNK